ncbi:hypothetical protein Sjap_020032 [Stephania japonica]|uniref:BHLH domain-containing protein n=1 Tax=Stephania japonica TaxID=461633 RepID=A0AAP0HVA2_9MAGN
MTPNDLIDNNIESPWEEQAVGSHNNSEDFHQEPQMIEDNQQELFINFFSSTSNIETVLQHRPDHRDQLNNSSSSSFIVEPSYVRPDSPLFLDLFDFHQDDDHPHQPMLESSESYNPSVILTLQNSFDNTDHNECDNDMFLSPEDCDKFFNIDHVHQQEQIVLKDQILMPNTNSSIVANHNSDKRRGGTGAGDHQDYDGDNYEEETGGAPLDDHLNKIGALNCKNLVSERNRRKRLSQQLLALRALVPNITKMDKRSVLVDALNYLRSIQEETERLVKELKEQQFKQPRLNINQVDPHPRLQIEFSRFPSVLLYASSKSRAQITEIETEKIEDRRFVVKITCKGSVGVGGDVLRVMESLGFEITYAAMQQLKPHETNTTTFIRVRKPGKMTEEKLKQSITNMALRTGLALQCP